MVQYVYQDGGETTHGYEDVFNNYINLLNTSTDTNDYSNEDSIDNDVNSFMKSLEGEEETESRSNYSLESLDVFSNSLNERLQDLEDRIFMMSFGDEFSYDSYTESNNYSLTDNDSIKQKQMMTESGGNPNAVGSNTKYGRAKGLFQFIDSTWERYKPHPNANIFNPKDNEKARDAYMSDLLKMFNGDIRKALASYNWGEGNVKKAINQHGENWDKNLPAETKKYLKSITGYKYGGYINSSYQNGGEITHGYEDIFNKYLSMLNTIQPDNTFDEQVEDNSIDKEVEDSLTELENNEELSIFENKVSEITNMVNSKLDYFNTMLDEIDMFNYNSSYEYNTSSDNAPPVNKQENPYTRSLYNEYNKKYNVGFLGIFPSAEHLKQNPNSDHNTGDAIDLQTNGVREDIANDIISNAKKHNVKYVIHNGKIWSSERANEGWRKYNGKNPHKGHIHVSHNR